MNTIKLDKLNMSDWKASESLSDWIDVTEHDDVLNMEQVTTAEFLTGKSFLSNCHLPDVKPNTKIVGICGITDWNKENDPKMAGNAAPDRKGWYFADFYLFRHLLKEVSSDQVWLTCVSPESAVEKYERYVYGDYTPKKMKNRHVVLDKSMLSGLNDVKTVSPEGLLDTVLTTISKTCIEANAEDRPVLILIFSASWQPNCEIEMGGENAEDPKPLTKKAFRQAIGSHTPEGGLCLLATEYRTGAWAINPDMKVAPVASKGKYFEDLAWPISGTIHQRPCGPEFASAISDMLLRINIKGYVTKEMDWNRGAESDEAEESLESLVKDILRNEESKDKSLFSGEDEWETEYSERIGIHSSELYRRWCLLKDASPGYDELLATVKSDAEMYFNSFPGLDYKVRNRELHNKLRGIIKGTATPNFAELELLRRQIDYRLEHMKMATAYKDLWDLPMKNCENVEVEIGAGVGTYRWDQLLKLVESYYLFDHNHGQGEEYNKGEWYIASCIHNQEWDDVQAVEKIQALILYRVTVDPVQKATGSVEPVVCSWRRRNRDFSYDQDFFTLQEEARQYFDSKLRVHDRASDNGLHNYLPSVLDGNREHGLGHLRGGVDHRFNQIMGTATLYKDFLGIGYPDCHEVDVEELSCNTEIEDLVGTYPLLNTYYHYRPYFKGTKYLAQCISRQAWSKNWCETIAKLDSLVEYRGLPTHPFYSWPGQVESEYQWPGVPNFKGASRIIETIDQLRLSRDEHIRVIIWKLGQITNCKIRSLPSNTCRRQHLPNNGAEKGVADGIGKLGLEVGSRC